MYTEEMFSRSSEANDSEFLENHEEISLVSVNVEVDKNKYQYAKGECPSWSK